jgi:hypothetical protein
VRALGGTIEVASHPDRGTRFEVTLPLDRKPGFRAVAVGPGTARTRSGGRPGSGNRRPS